MEHDLDQLIHLARKQDMETEFNSRTKRNQFYWSSEWRKLKHSVLKRDHHECQLCKREGRLTLDNLMVHHIKPLEYYPLLRLDADNLVTLCKNCHNKVHGLLSQYSDEWW